MLKITKYFTVILSNVNTFNEIITSGFPNIDVQTSYLYKNTLKWKALSPLRFSIIRMKLRF